MKKLVILSLLLASVFACAAQQAVKKPTILLSGASFAQKENGWFEFGCAAIGATPLNRAVGGDAIVACANRMHKGKLYSREELEHIDAFVLMQVHERDVFNDPDSVLREKYTDYAYPLDRNYYVAAFDYVIKRYMTECYELRNDPASKYYGTPHGKPAIIVLCTHWHDGRTLYNATVRQLAAKWGLPLVEFDKYIGFSRFTPHPVTGQQHSLLYALDSRETDGVLYGWHPLRGDTYIQRRMAAIFADVMRRVLPVWEERP